MVRSVCRAVAVAAAMLAAAAVGSASSGDDVPSVHDIMHEGHQGKKSLLSVLKSAVKDGKWDDAQKPAKKMKEFGEAIGKNKQEKGTDESWKKQTEQYKKTTAAIFKAVEKKDKAEADKQLGVFGKSCKGCHDNHR